MRITRHKTLYQLAFMPALFPVNCYLVEREKSIILIDAGLAFCCKGILKACAGIGKPLSHIILTHTHADHTGAVNALKAHCPGVSVCVSARDHAILMGDTSLASGEADRPVRGGFDEKARFAADRFLSAGDSIEGLRVLSLPGHTPGSLALYDATSKAMVAGDTFVSRGGFRLAGDTSPLFPFPARATWDMATAARNAEQLLEYDIEVLALGHGRMVHAPGPLIQAALERGRRKANAAK